MINPQKKKKMQQMYLNSKLKGITICVKVFCNVYMGVQIVP